MSTTTEAAQFARLRGQLLARGLRLRCCHQDSRFFNALGRYYVTAGGPGGSWVHACDVSLNHWLGLLEVGR